jgi:anaerobic selenocysteine-containing dehydrogenase
MNEHMQIRQLIAKVVPGLESLATIDQTKQEFQIPGRTFHTSHFSTPSRNAHFAAIAIPDLEGTPDQLRMMTIRSEGQFNTVVYEEEDIYRGQDRRDVILMNTEDMLRRCLSADQKVCVRSVAGAMRNVRVRPFDIKAGNVAMYFPEANVLVPAMTDPDSKTPAFKSVLITIEPEPASAARGSDRIFGDRVALAGSGWASTESEPIMPA